MGAKYRNVVKIKNMQTKNKKINISLHKYLISSIFVFILFFISTSLAFAFFVNDMTANGSEVITEIFTENANNVTDIGANLWGSMIPGVDYPDSVDAYFRYSTVAPDTVTPIFCNDIYGSDMRSTNEVKISGQTVREVNTTLNYLAPNTTYFFCMVGSTEAGQIAYGGVKSFTTLLPSGFAPVITTENALVVNETSAYLNETYNTTVPVKIWFEYRKVWAVVNTTTYDSNSWIKVGEKTRNANTSNKIFYLLEGLTKGTSYEFRAGIKDNSTTGVSYGTFYGDIKTFTTKGSTGTIPGGGGIPYVDPCANIDDVNCNGTGGPGIIGGTTGNSSLPDLTASVVSPSSAIVGVSSAFSSVIRNQGKNSTAYTPIINNIAPGNSGAVSFWNSIWGTNKALAVVATTTQNIVPTTAKGSFYNFFQISTVNPTSVINNIAPANGGAAVSFLDNFKTNKALAAVATTGGGMVSNAFTNLPPIKVSPLGAKSSTTITQNFAFNSVGTYYMRACADKKSPTDLGLIQESYENNNCSLWTTIRVMDPTKVCTDSAATNYGGSLPCNIKTPPQLCIDTSASNYGLPVPCAYGTSLCLDPTATNYGNSLPCNYGTGNGNGTGNGTGTANPSNLVIGQIATPPIDAVVHYHEGIETVFARQIVADINLAKNYGYQDGADLQNFAWTLADLLARTFGYVNSSGKEIRVSRPDIAAYQLYMNNGVLTVYEYYDSKIVNIQKMTDVLRNKYYYEYYFKK